MKLEEGCNCPECKEGILDWVSNGNCSCHINPPCSACVDALLTCDKCGFQEEQEKVISVLNSAPFTLRVYFPQVIDENKINWTYESHTHFSMIKKGTYPDGMSREDVEKEVKGTFGGRFEQFGNGKFRYIAYTD